MKSRTSTEISQFFFFLDKPSFAFYFAFLAYFALSNLDGNPFHVSDASYFNYLADAFLHGQLALRLIPKTVHDLSYFHGHYYLYWPPMPAVVLMPFVALFGVNFSDVFFNVVLAALNVAVIAALLRTVGRENIIHIRAEYRGILIFFFTLGTVHVLLTLVGGVWYTGQLLGFLFVGLAYLSAMQLKGARSFFITGLLMACAMLTRNHLIFAGIWPAYYLISRNWDNRPKLILHSFLGLLPALAFGLLFLAYNFARFGNPFEVGLTYHDMAPNFIVDYHRYGAFNLHYVPINFYYQYIHYPFPFSDETYMGSSLFLLSPVFFYALKGVFQAHRDPNILFLLVSILLTSLPILLLMGSGWVQYGPRYTLDFTVPLLLLTASGVEGTSKRLLIWLTALSILQYIPGIFLYVSIFP